MEKTRTRTSLTIAIALVFCGVLALSGCQKNPRPAEKTPDGGGSSNTTVTPSVTATITATPEPLALTVNGEGIPLAEYQASLQQLQSAETELGTSHTADEQRQMVLDDLTDEALLAQGAEKDGMKADDSSIQSQYEQLTSSLNASGGLTDWMSKMGYDDNSLHSALQRSIQAAWERDKIIKGVPETADQVEARQMLFQTQDTANSILSKLDNGSDFTTLAFQYDPLTGGDLGWFPRGYLTVQAVEDAAFSLEKGQHSQIIATDLGYVILLVEDKDSQHPLSADARLALQKKALQDWLTTQQQAADIKVLLP